MRTAAIASLILPLLVAGVARADEESDLDLAQAGGNLPTVLVEAQRLSGPDVSATGAAVYSVGAQDIGNLPTGAQGRRSPTSSRSCRASPSTKTSRSTSATPRDRSFNTRSTASWCRSTSIPTRRSLSMLNTLFVDRLDLRVGVLPARYGYATGGVVDVRVEGWLSGARRRGQPRMADQRSTFSPSIEYAACDGALSELRQRARRRGATPPSAARPRGRRPFTTKAARRRHSAFGPTRSPSDTRLSLLLAATAATTSCRMRRDSRRHTASRDSPAFRPRPTSIRT